MQYYEYRLIENDFIDKSSKEIYLELSKYIQVCSVSQKSNDIKKDAEFQQRWTKFLYNNSYWWEEQLKEALINNNSYFSQIYPILYNDQHCFLAKYLDYIIMNENIFRQTQERLYDIPTEAVKNKKLKYEIFPQFSEAGQFLVQLCGQKMELSNFFKVVEDKKIRIFEQPLNLKFPLQRQSEQREKENIYEINFSELSFGLFISKMFYQYFNINNITQSYGQILEFSQLTLQFDQNTVNIYICVNIEKVREIFYKISFKVQPGSQNEKYVEGNKVYDNAPITVIKDSDKIYFLIRFQGHPKCFMSERIEKNDYSNFQYRDWWRVNNFVTNRILKQFHLGLIGQSQVAKITVNYEQTLSQEFLKFCKMIEEQKLLHSYHPMLKVKLKSLSGIPQQEFNLSYINNWILLSAYFAKDNLVLPSFSLTKFYEFLKEKNQFHIFNAILQLAEKKKRNNNRETFSQQDFQDRLIAVNNPKRLINPIMVGTLTPSTLLPNYCEDDNTIFTQLQMRKKSKNIEPMNLKEHIIKIKIRDEDESILQFDIIQVPQKFQNKLLVSGYFRDLLKKGIQILDQDYQIIGFNSKKLRKGECYLIHSKFAVQLRIHMFQHLAKSYLNRDSPPVAAFQFQGIMDYYFQKYRLFIQIDPFAVNHKEKHKNGARIFNQKYFYKIFYPIAKIGYKKWISLIKDHNDAKNYTNFIIRFENKFGLVKLSLNKPEKFVLYDDMKLAYLDLKQKVDQQDFNIQLPNQLQVIKCLGFKEATLNIAHYLNLQNFMYNFKQGSIPDQLYKYLKGYVKIQQDKQQGFQVSNNLADFKLPIQKGAKLYATYDYSLEPDQVFIYIRNQQENYIVEQPEVLIFRENYILDDGYQKFRTCDDYVIKQKLKDKYQNIIVFSAYVDPSVFIYDQYSQRFTAIWDEDIIPIDLGQNVANRDEDMKKLSFSNRGENDINFSKLSQEASSIFPNTIENYKFKGWVSTLYNQITDYFVLFHTQNMSQILMLYAKFIYMKIKQDQELIKNTSRFQQIYDALKLANYNYLWYAETQAQQTMFPKEIRDLMHYLNKSELNLQMLIQL
uniref:RNA-dependent RNA polymerase 3 n=1 Tax=Paramecium bursaria TaxID=74790 RepID=A0A8G1CXY7_9CILI|nr:RNA-dependent RNA polymerase 3 [Paramecium bursaria]